MQKKSLFCIFLITYLIYIPPPPHTHLPPQPPSHSHPREQGEQKPCAPPVELRHIPLGRQLYHFFLHPHIHHRIAFHACTPSISPFRPCQINGIATLHFPHIHTIVHYNRVDCLVYGVGDGVAVCGGEARVNALAARAHKARHTKDKHQVL